MLTYDVVIATLNRASVVKDALALIEQQSEPPQRIIIVDASDDHDGFKAAVMPGIDQRRFDYLFLRSRQKNLPAQRNQGLEHVRSDIVLMPDDDSMLFPHTAREIMAAYRLDKEGRIAGVSGLSVPNSPSEEIVHVKLKSRALKEAIEPVRNWFENRLVPKPFDTFPAELWRRQEIPAWIDGERFALVPTIGGFRMSLRADVAKAMRFDETLGYGIGYATHEDMEISLRLQAAGYLLIGARAAPIFHNVFPSKRAGGFNYGFCQIANYIYACRRNMPEESRGWAGLSRYMRYKLLVYRLGAGSPYGRDVYRGALAAWRGRKALTNARPSQLEQAYKALCDALIRRPQPSV